MKRVHVAYFFSFCLCLMMSVTVSAQTFGVRGGISSLSMLSQVGGQDVFTDQAFKIGFQAGVQADLSISDDLMLETGLFLASKGLDGSLEVAGLGTVETVVDVLYLNLPAHVRYDGAIGENTIYGSVGPFLGFALNGTQTVTSPLGTAETDLKDAFKSIDFGIGVGVGVMMGDIQVGLGYDLGLVNLAEVTTNGEDSKTRAINLFVTYKFNQGE